MSDLEEFDPRSCKNYSSSSVVVVKFSKTRWIDPLKNNLAQRIRDSLENVPKISEK